MTRGFLSLILCAALAAPARAVHNPRALVHLTTRSWFTLDPAGAFDAVSVIVTGNIYEPLIAFKSARETDAFIPFLAERVPARDNALLSADGLEYRFPIRKGVPFHDGSQLTPEDVRYSLLRFMLGDPEGGPAALLLKPVLGVYGTRDASGKVTLDFARAAAAVRVDGDAVVVRLAKADATFLKVLASLPIIVSRDWAAAHGEWDGSAETWRAFNNRPVERSHLHAHANGTGPFKLGAAAADGSQLTLERHDGYWRGPAALERVYLRAVPGKAVRMAMLENGDADTVYFEDRDYHELGELEGVRVVDGGPGAALGEVLYFNFAAAPGSRLGSGKLDGEGVPPDFFADPRVRAGFARALDYEGYLRRGLCMRGERALSAVPGALLPQSGRAPEFDLEEARRLLKDARGGELWEKGFTVSLTYSTSNAGRAVLAELLQAGLAKVNPKFKLLLEPVSSGALYEAAEAGELPLFVTGYYADYPDPQSFVFGMLHSAGYYPKAQRYRNPELDALIERAAGESAPERREALYREILALAAKDQPQVYTYWPARFAVGRDWVRGLDDGHNIANMGLNGFPYFYAYSKSD